MERKEWWRYLGCSADGELVLLNAGEDLTHVHVGQVEEDGTLVVEAGFAGKEDIITREIYQRMIGARPNAPTWMFGERYQRLLYRAGYLAARREED